MKKLDKYFKYCFEIAEDISKNEDLKLSKGIMDVPGMDDSNGRAPFAEFPTLTSDDEKHNFRILFTYDIEGSKDIDGKSLGSINRDYQTPWLRMVYYIKDIDKVNFYRIYKRERSFFNTFKKTFFITPGKELNSSSNLNNYYYLDCSINRDDIMNKIQISDILSRLESFPNLKMIRLDSKELLIDIKCEENEDYTSELILKYIETVDDLMDELLKV